MRKTLIAGLVVALGITGADAAEPGQNIFSPVGDFPLGPSANRIDYQSLDPATGRLYVSMMGAGKLLVFDTGQNKVLAQRDGFPKITGVLAVPALHRIYASVPGAGLGPSVAVGLGML